LMKRGVLKYNIYVINARYYSSMSGCDRVYTTKEKEC
jgi:hypothetical protein